MIDYAIKKIIDKTLNVDCTPSFGTGKLPLVTYTHTPINGGVIAQSQFEIKIIDSSMDQALEMKEKLNKMLDMLDNQPSLIEGNYVIRSNLSGGGQLFNDTVQVWEISAIYIMKWRKLNGK